MTGDSFTECIARVTIGAFCWSIGRARLGREGRATQGKARKKTRQGKAGQGRTRQGINLTVFPVRAPRPTPLLALPNQAT